MKWGIKDWFIINAVVFLGSFIVAVVGCTIRWRIKCRENVERAKEKSGNVIYAFWHNRIFPMLYILRYTNTAVIISQSRDGEIIKRIVNVFGCNVIRGSSTRGGTKAFFEVMDILQKKYDFGITPDGPRGPKYSVSKGTVKIAKLSGKPVFPMDIRIRNKIVFNSWDNFMIPLPFTRIDVNFREPLYFGNKESDEEAAERLREIMMKYTLDCD